MRDVLVKEYNLEVRWVDLTAMTTGENALVAAAKDLQAEGLTRVALVTDAIHMPRSRQVFEAAGLEVIACPTAYAGPTSVRGLPAGAWRRCVTAFSCRTA